MVYLRKKRSTGIHLEIKVLNFLDDIVESEKYQSCVTRSELINAICNAFMSSDLPIEEKIKPIRGLVYKSRNE